MYVYQVKSYSGGAGDRRHLSTKCVWMVDKIANPGAKNIHEKEDIKQREIVEQRGANVRVLDPLTTL